MQDAAELNQQNGRPMQSRTLPLDWAAAGWYAIVEHSAGALVNERRGLQKTAQFTHDDVQVPATKDLNKFKIENNFSLGRATLFEGGGFSRRNLCAICLFLQCQGGGHADCEG